MGVITYDHEITSSIPPSKMFKAFIVDADNLIPKVLPQAIKNVEILEGYGGVGTVKLITFGEEISSHTDTCWNRLTSRRPTTTRRGAPPEAEETPPTVQTKEPPPPENPQPEEKPSPDKAADQPSKPEDDEQVQVVYYQPPPEHGGGYGCGQGTVPYPGGGQGFRGEPATIHTGHQLM
ncbi:major allergen Pru ar 1-like [Olea europaea subsp. europaea]|uniref:Major allergen Pru ar 1-like n=1 Tax=Olea europaea subsp. europaea TaxID=158383 RepID=A0A8S0SX89_OLEEU|nr:major allergen Pru ar 1-like [Olea europaea subsp. europaea]